MQGFSITGAEKLFGIGSQELLVIFLVVLILFGADRIPEVARALGKGIRDVKRAAGEFESEIQEIARQKDELIGKDKGPTKRSAARSGGSRGGQVPSDQGGAAAPKGADKEPGGGRRANGESHEGDSHAPEQNRARGGNGADGGAPEAGGASPHSRGLPPGEGD